MKTLESDFKLMVGEYKHMLYAVCLLFSKSANAADALFQELLINLWRGYAASKSNVPRKEWIWKTCFNTCVSFDRHKKYIRTLHVSLPFDFYEDDYAEAVQVRSLLDFMRKFKIFDRAVLMLHLENMEAAGIAAVIGTTEKNIKLRLEHIQRIIKDDSDICDLNSCRSQYDMLKAILSRHDIVNDKLFERTFHDKIFDFSKAELWGPLLDLMFVSVVMLILTVFVPTSVFFRIFTAAFFMASIVYTCWFHSTCWLSRAPKCRTQQNDKAAAVTGEAALKGTESSIKNKIIPSCFNRKNFFRGSCMDGISDDTMLFAAKNLLLLKKRSYYWICVGMPAIFIWLLWFMFEVLRGGSHSCAALIVLSSALLVAFVASLFCLCREIKFARHINRVVADINCFFEA